MCWEILVYDANTNEILYRIDNIKNLLAIYESFDINIPQEVTKGYTKEEIKEGFCLCPIPNNVLAVDKITEDLRNGYGAREAWKINDEEGIYKINPSKILPIKKGKLRNDNIFHRIILEEVFNKNRKIRFEFW